MDAIVSGTDTIPRQGEAHQVDADAAGLNHNAVRRGMQIGDHVIRAGLADRAGQARYGRARLDLLQRLHRGCWRARRRQRPLCGAGQRGQQQGREG